MKIKLYTSEDLNFVEFSFSQDQGDFVALGKNSRYLHSAVFSLIQSAFEMSHPDYAYYQAISYENSSVIKLRNNLAEQIAMIGQIGSPEELEAFALKQVAGIDFLNEIKTFIPKWRISWENIRDQLKEVVVELLDLVDDCIDEDKTFWIKGY